MVFSFGPWSASHPIYKTYTQTNKIVYGSIFKEPHVLPYIFTKNHYEWETIRLSEYESCKNQNREGYEMLSPNISVDGYIELLLERYDNHKDEYRGVSDATNGHTVFGEDIIDKFADKFKKYFDVKVLMICRDPVRRLFSHLMGQPKPNPSLEGYGQNKRFELALNYMSTPTKVRYPEQKLDHTKDLYMPYMCSNYQGIYDNWSKFFDTHVIIMEDLWAGRNNELDRLNNFLDSNITKLHKNLYYPFKGLDYDYHPKLEDQMRSEKEWITKENLQRGREIMSWCYTINGNKPWEIDEWS